jgi:class 3 adenylate cyclase
MSTQERTALAATPRVVLVCDLAGSMRTFDTRRDAEMADFLEAYYARVAEPGAYVRSSHAPPEPGSTAGVRP